jgi:hypothetical protein
MIKFFRKIRQNLLTENKFSKYLIYAIGEIILVVIGILIALQINNWNEEQKIEKEEISILNNLLESLYSAKEQSKSEILKENQLKESLLIALGKNSNKNKFSINSISDSLFYDILWNSNPRVPVLNSYSDIKNTGKIGIIKNRSIRENFTNLELTLTGLNTMVKDRLTVQQMRIDDILVNDINFVRLLKVMEPSINIDNELQNNYNLILNNQKTRNLLALKLSLTYSTINNRQELGDEIDNLIHLLEVELKRKR